MTIVDVFSKRQQRQLSPGNGRYYRYDPIPETLRNQVIHIWDDIVSNEEENFWAVVEKTLARELGMLRLGSSQPKQNCMTFIQEARTAQVLDIIEVSFLLIESMMKQGTANKSSKPAQQRVESAVSELNQRFAEPSLGYALKQGRITILDNSKA